MAKGIRDKAECSLVLGGDKRNGRDGKDGESDQDAGKYEVCFSVRAYFVDAGVTRPGGKMVVIREDGVMHGLMWWVLFDVICYTPNGNIRFKMGCRKILTLCNRGQ